MLMDEPFGALDPVTRDTLGNAYRSLHERLGMTTVMVTHDMQEAVLLADRIVVMSAGRILADGTPAALMAEPADGEVAALMEMPRRQAERIHTMMAGGNGAGQAPHG
jgi:osmoprotectant transport system ATP-binding protein